MKLTKKDIEELKERAKKPVTSWMGAMAKGAAIRRLEQAGIEYDTHSS